MELSHRESILLNALGEIQYQLGRLQGMTHEEARTYAIKACTVLLLALYEGDSSSLSRKEIEIAADQIGKGLDYTIRTMNEVRSEFGAHIDAWAADRGRTN